MDFSFLTNLTLVDTGRMRQPKERNPKGMSVRIYANGEVYPSEELVKKYYLEYINKDSTEKANGIDVVDSSEWTPLAGKPRMILFGVTPKSEAKVDLFKTCRFNDDNTPKSSVVSQGATSEILLELVRSMGYITDQQKYVDLVLLEQYPITPKDGLSFIPKTVESGTKKGERTYERRENVTYYPVVTSEEYEKMTNQQTPNITDNVLTTTN